MYSLPFEKLAKKWKVAIIGIGGSGSYMAAEIRQLDTCLRALNSECGLEVTLIDGSNVTEANIARQQFFPTQVGQNKAEAAVWTANNLYGKAWKAIPRHLTSTQTLREYDLIITALDRPSTRFMISKMTADTYWLDMGNDATSGQVVFGQLHNKNQKVLPHICDLFDYSELSDDDAEVKSCSAEQSINRQELGTNQTAARIGAQILWNLWRHGKIETNGAYFNVTTLNVDPITEEDWAIYGYTPPINCEQN